MKKNTFDITIIGGGPSGSFSAFLLSKIGYKVALIEKQSSIKRKVCGEYLCPSGVKILENNNILGLFDHYKRLTGMDIYSQKGTKLRCEFPQSQQNYGLSVIRGNFDNILLNNAKNIGATVISGKRVAKCQFNSQWDCKLDDGSNIYSKILIGADGRQSIVAKTLNLELKTNSDRVAIHCLIAPRKNLPRHGQMHLFNDGSYCGINPINDQQCNLSIVCSTIQLKEHKNPREYLLKCIERKTELKNIFGDNPNIGVVKSLYPLRYRVSKVATKNSALVGDAAGFIDPLTGEGMYQALLSATILAKNIQKHNWHLAYVTKINKTTSAKKRLNIGFQWVIKHPKICELIAKFLLKKTKRPMLFIGIIGNIYKPMQALRRIF